MYRTAELQNLAQFSVSVIKILWQTDNKDSTITRKKFCTVACKFCKPLGLLINKYRRTNSYTHVIKKGDRIQQLQLSC